MVKVLLVWDMLGDNIRFFAVDDVTLDELALLQKVHSTYINGDMGEQLTKEFTEFFYGDDWRWSSRLKEIKGPIPLVGENYHSVYLVGQI